MCSKGSMICWIKLIISSFSFVGDKILTTRLAVIASSISVFVVIVEQTQCLFLHKHLLAEKIISIDRSQVSSYSHKIDSAATRVFGYYSCSSFQRKIISSWRWKELTDFLLFTMLQTPVYKVRENFDMKKTLANALKVIMKIWSISKQLIWLFCY